MSEQMMILIALICGIVFGVALMLIIMANDKRLTHCPECKFYFAPVCTFYKWLPMVSRKGFCYHAQKGKYQGITPKVKYMAEKDCIKITGISYDGVQCILCTNVKTGENGFYNPQTNIFTALESR